MKIFKILLVIAVITTAFFACQKELKFPDTGVAYGTFKKDAGGDCLPVTVTGVFKVDSVLTNALFVDVQINANTPGNFDIRSDTVNGISFYKVGTVPFGVNTIRLYPSGKPIAAGTNTFTVKFGASTCSFDITTVGAGTPAATFNISGSPNACTGATIGGTYTEGVALLPANTLTIEVNVATVGTYTISAAATPANGFSFTGTGVFTTPGVQNVTLTGSGKPTTAGVSTFSVTNITNSCTYPITVLPASPTAATFSFDGGTGTCTNFLIAGVYTAGVATNSSNTVTLNVTVLTPGTYTITTPTVDGITFSKTGTFTAPGSATVVLTASNTPTNSGTFSFTMGGSGCSFTVPVVAPVNNDYFPLTNNSWWSYDMIGISGSNPATDTVYNLLIGTKSISGNTYSQMQESYAGAINDTTNYRKSINDYFQYGYADYYSAYIGFDDRIYANINFLKENATVGTSIPTQTFSGTYSDIPNGIIRTPMDIKYDFKITETNATVIINSVTYTNVIHVTNAVTLVIPAGSINDVSENDDYYYAKGVGLIKIVYTPTTLLTGANTITANIKHYKVF